MSFESHGLSIGSQSHLSQSHVSQVNPSLGSHASIPSEQEDCTKKKKRRKRRKRARNRIMPMGSTPNSLTMTSGCISTDPGSFASSEKRRGSIGSSVKQSSDRHADNESSDSASSVDHYRLPPGGHRQVVKAMVEPQPEDDKKSPAEEVPLAAHPKKILVAACEDGQDNTGFEATEEGEGQCQDESPGPRASTPVEDHEPQPSTSCIQQQVKRKNSPVPAPMSMQQPRWKNPFVPHRHRVHPVANVNPFVPQTPYMYQNPWQNPFITQHMTYGGPYMYNNLVVPPRECPPFSQQYPPYWNAQPFGVYSPYSQPSSDCLPQPQLPGECIQQSTPSDTSQQQQCAARAPREAKGEPGVETKLPETVSAATGQSKSPGRMHSPQADTPSSSRGLKPGRVKTPRADTPPPGRGQPKSPRSVKSLQSPSSPPTVPNHQASALHAQTTSTYSMFTASSCLPDVETPLVKGSWLSGSQGSASGSRPIGSWLSGSEFMGSASEMKPIESWLAGLEVEDEGVKDRRNSGKRPKKRPKIKSKDEVIAIELKPTSFDVD